MFSYTIILALLLPQASTARKKLRAKSSCITSGRVCFDDNQCCGDNNCYKRSRRDEKRCVPCRKRGSECRFDRHCCTDRCSNRKCVIRNGGGSSKCDDCDRSGFTKLDDENIEFALNLWFDDRDEAEEEYGELLCWDVSRVTDMSFLFFERPFFNEDLNCWDTSNVVDMSLMFDGATRFNGDISDWNVKNVRTMTLMFGSTSEFNRDISDWNVRSVTNMGSMFLDARNFNVDLSDWDVRNVATMDSMFLGAEKFNRDLSDWDIDNVDDMDGMFNEASNFDQELCWDVAGKSTLFMFEGSDDACIKFVCCADCPSRLLCEKS